MNLRTHTILGALLLLLLLLLLGGGSAERLRAASLT